MHFLISILSDVILLQWVLSFIPTEPLACEAHYEHAISWQKSLPDCSLPIKLWAFHSCKSAIHSFASSFSPLSLQSKRYALPPCLFTFFPLDIHLSAPLTKSVSNATFLKSLPASGTACGLGPVPGPKALQLSFSEGSFSRGFVNLAFSELSCQIWGSWRTGTNSYGSFFFAWLLRFLCAGTVQQMHWIPVFGRIWSFVFFIASMLHHPTELFQPPNLTAPLALHPLLWQLNEI